MMLTDDQFKDFIREISLGREVSERLVTIETIVRMNHQSYEDQKRQIAVDIMETRKTAAKAHERIDGEVKARLLFAGGLGGFGVICAVVSLILKLTGKL